jgi:retrograde regulation protein 2
VHNERLNIHLEIFVGAEAAKGVDHETLLGLFKNLKKQKHAGKRVTVTVKPLP